MSDLIRNSRLPCLDSMEKRWSIAKAFQTSLRRNTPWSTRQCSRIAQKESKLNFPEFRHGSSGLIAT